MKKLLFILLPICFLASCEFSVETKTEKKRFKVEKEDSDLGNMPQVDNEVFDNIYIADEHICEEQNLPVTRFAIEYPDSVEVTFPNNGRDHITFQKKHQDIVVEEMSIGNSTVTVNKKSLAVDLLEQLAADLKDQIPSMEVDFIGMKSFKGEMIYLFQGSVDFTGYEEQGYTGIYNMMCLLPLPQNNEDMNGVLITFLASQDSEIKSHRDFETSGMINSLFSTFRYIE